MGRRILSGLSGGKILKLAESLVSCVASSTRARYQPPVPSSTLLSEGVHAKDPEFEMLPILSIIEAALQAEGETN
jgi:hypothetical protein